VTGDDIGLSFFTQHAPLAPSGKPSAFGPVDQDRVIARIDAVDEDDLTSSFFGDSLLDVENAATRSFDIGIRMLGTDQHRQAPAEAAPALPLTTAGIDASPAPAADPVEVPVAGRRMDDAVARSAFILGGPGALQ